MRTVACVVVSMAVLAGCSTLPPNVHGRPWMVKWVSPTQAVHYSEYFHARVKIADGRVLAHLIITLGKERLPPDYSIEYPLATNGRLTPQDYRDGVYEAVSEVYFTNLSDAPVVLSDVSVRTLGGAGTTVLPGPATVQPKRFAKSAPIVDVGSLYQTEYPFAMTCMVDGAEVKVQTTAQRGLVENIGKGWTD